jgi:hypothetical protein
VDARARTRKLAVGAAHSAVARYSVGGLVFSDALVDFGWDRGDALVDMVDVALAPSPVARRLLAAVPGAVARPARRPRPSASSVPSFADRAPAPEDRPTPDVSAPSALDRRPSLTSRSRRRSRPNRLGARGQSPRPAGRQCRRRQRRAAPTSGHRASARAWVTRSRAPLVLRPAQDSQSSPTPGVVGGELSQSRERAGNGRRAALERVAGASRHAEHDPEVVGQPRGERAQVRE